MIVINELITVTQDEVSTKPEKNYYYNTRRKVNVSSSTKNVPMAKPKSEKHKRVVHTCKHMHTKPEGVG